MLWIALLASGQAADLLTTQVNLSRGALEGNLVIANLLQSGGFALVFGLKFGMVLAMALIVRLVQRYAGNHPGERAAFATGLLWRGLQLCVIVLTATALHNVVVLARIQGWPAPELLTTFARLFS